MALGVFSVGSKLDLANPAQFRKIEHYARLHQRNMTFSRAKEEGLWTFL